MPTKLMMIFVGLDFVFAGCGGLVLAFSLMSEQRMRETPRVDNVAQNLLLGQCPLTGTLNIRRATVAAPVLGRTDGDDIDVPVEDMEVDRLFHQVAQAATDGRGNVLTIRQAVL